MSGKLWVVTLAAAWLGAAASTPASAADWHDGYHAGWSGPRFYLGAPVSYGYGNCYVRELWQTPSGPRWRLVNRCW